MISPSIAADCPNTSGAVVTVAPTISAIIRVLPDIWLPPRFGFLLHWADRATHIGCFPVDAGTETRTKRPGQKVRNFDGQVSGAFVPTHLEDGAFARLGCVESKSVCQHVLRLKVD